MSRRGKIIKGTVLVLLTATIVCYRLADDIGLDFKPDDRWRIVNVIDGDTVELPGGEHLRLANIDTPEVDAPLYEEAKQFLTELALGKTARVEYIKQRRDKYGRLLGYLYIDSIFAGEAILEKGLGYLMIFSNNDLNRRPVQKLLAAQRRAMKAKTGLFALERTPEDYYTAGRGRFRLHRPGCESAGRFRPDRHRLFDTREEALYEGLSPCRKCRP